MTAPAQPPVETPWPPWPRDVRELAVPAPPSTVARLPPHRRIARWIAAVIGALVIVVAAPAEAHPVETGFARLDVATDGSDGVGLTLDIDVALAARLLGVEPTELDAKAVADRAADLAIAAYAKVPVETPGGPCTWLDPAAVIRAGTVTLTGRAACPDATSWRWAPAIVHHPALSAGFQLLVRARTTDGERIATLDRAHPAIEVAVERKRSRTLLALGFIGAIVIAALAVVVRRRSAAPAPEL